MDDRRFDSLTRNLVRTGSRRSIAGALLAAAATMLSRGALAQPGEVPLGGVCYGDGQCAQDGQIDYVYCDDNGYEYDGEFNCCTYAGYCTTDEHCCGATFCSNGFCANTIESDDYYRGPGEPCWSDDQCVTMSGPIFCDDNGFVDDESSLHCCAYEGGLCTDHAGCCGYLGCFDGFCAAFPEEDGGLLSLGEACSMTLECSGGGYDTDCTYNGIADEPVCCLINGAGCAFDSDCCGTDLCLFNSFDGAGHCAQYFGGFCLSDLGCAEGLVCIDGYCQ